MAMCTIIVPRILKHRIADLSFKAAIMIINTQTQLHIKDISKDSAVAISGLTRFLLPLTPSGEIRPASSLALGPERRA